MRKAYGSFGWALFIFSVNLGYILLEFAFNSRLVDVASGVYAEATQLQQLELTGRTLAGVGLALAIIGWVKPYRYKFIFTVLLVSAAFIISIPLMYQLQERLVRYLVNEHFDTHDRQVAHYAILLKSGIHHGSLQLKDVEFDPQHRDSPQQKTFMALVGGMVFSSDSVINQMRSNREAITQHYLHNYVVDNEEKYWHEYERAFGIFHAQWKQYQDASRQYVAAVNSSEQRIDSLWRDVEAHLANGWDTYRQARSEFETQARAQTADIAAPLNEYFTGRDECLFDECRERYDAAYRKQITARLGRYIEPEFWLTDKEQEWFERNCGGEIHHPECDSEPGMAWDDSVAALAPKLLLLQEEAFARQSGGYGVGVSSYDAFIVHPATARHTRAALADKGLMLSARWQVGNNAEFRKVAATYIRAQIDREWGDTVRMQLRASLNPNLSYNEFVKSDYVTGQLRLQLGNNYVEGARPDFNRDEFFDRILLPVVERKTQYLSEPLYAELTEFVDGARFAEQSKQYIRLLIIPPVAMAFSLFFGLIAVGKLPMLALAMYHPWRGTTRTFMILKYKVVVFMALALPIVLLPFGLSNSLLGSSQSGFNAMLEETKNEHPLVGYATQWVIHIQPAVYPVGQLIEKTRSN